MGWWGFDKPVFLSGNVITELYLLPYPTPHLFFIGQGKTYRNPFVYVRVTIGLWEDIKVPFNKLISTLYYVPAEILQLIFFLLWNLEPSYIFF